MFNKPFRGQALSRRMMLLVARIVTSVCPCGKSDNCYLKFRLISFQKRIFSKVREPKEHACNIYDVMKFI